MTPIHFHQEMYIRDLNFEFEETGSTEDVDSAQAAMATSHRDWLDIKSVDVSAQKGLSNLFASKEKLEYEKKRKHEEHSRSTAYEVNQEREILTTRRT